MKISKYFVLILFYVFVLEANASSTIGCDVSTSCEDFDSSRVFDFVVIGTGPASGPIIRRLVDAGRSVIVIEKGPYFFSTIPDASARGDEFDDTFQVREKAILWNFTNRSIKQVEPRTYGIQEGRYITSRRREFPYKQAQGFGGQTLIYGGFAMRPSPAAFDDWNITFDEMLEWYEKSEAFSWACDVVPNANESHSCSDFSGFLTVLLQKESDYPRIARIIPKFCAEGARGPKPMWLDTTGDNPPDYNGLYPTRAFCGSPQVFHGQIVSPNGKVSYPRDSLQETYLPCGYLISKQKNLKICVNSTAERLLLDADKNVIGVVLSGVGITIKGQRFVMAAGVRFSPQLLMSSGIGDKTSFDQLGVSTNVDLPDVGRYFHDEWGFTLAFKIANSNITPWTWRKIDFNDAQMQLIKWATGAQGDNFTDVQLYVRLANDLLIDDYLPDFFKMGPKDKNSLAIRINLHQKDTFGQASGVFPVGTNGEYVNRFKYYIEMFDDPEKSDRFLQGAISGYEISMKLVKKMLNQSLKKGGERLRLRAFDSTAALITAANQGAQSFMQALTDWGNLLALHGAGTCGIGRVVDSDLKVLQVSNLYIADMSVMPYPVDANPTATLYALGERLAEHLIPLSEKSGVKSSLVDDILGYLWMPGSTLATGYVLGILTPIILYRICYKRCLWSPQEREEGVRRTAQELDEYNRFYPEGGAYVYQAVH